MNDMLVKNTEIESEDTQEPKTYDLRPLVASDMGMICKIITAIGVRQFKECFNIEQTEDVKEDIKKVGFSVMLDITGIIISNIPKAEEEIQVFLASLSGMKLAEIKKCHLLIMVN